MAALLLALGVANASLAAAEDRPAPPLVLPSDVVTRAPRLSLSLSARAPWQRAYWLTVAFAASRHWALEARLGLDEDTRPMVGGGIVVRPLGGRLEGPLLRMGASYRATAEAGGDEGALLLDATAGASVVVQGVYADAGAGVLCVVPPLGDRVRASFVLDARLGLVF